MSKIVCSNCNSNNIVVVNEMIEKPEKEGQGFFTFLYIIFSLAIVVGFFFIVSEDAIISAVGVYVFIGSILFLILTYIFRLLQPFRYENKTKCICLDCGDTWYLDDKKQNVFTNSNF